MRPKPDGKSRVDDAMQKKLQKELGPAAQQEDKPKDPLLQVAETMREVQQRLGQRDSGEVTQQLAAADRLRPGEIDRAGEEIGILQRQEFQRPQADGQRQEAGKTRTALREFFGARPGKRSEASVSPRRSRRGGKKSPRADDESLSAELQGRDREQVLEVPSEYFLPEYELEIEDYFRRLSEDQPELEKP